LIYTIHRSEKTFPRIHRTNDGFVAEEPFDSPDWIFETKLDGYRAIAVIDDPRPS
jgi:bifunctional non-homologous end joining protein LigD